MENKFLFAEASGQDKNEALYNETNLDSPFDQQRSLFAPFISGIAPYLTDIDPIEVPRFLLDINHTNDPYRQSSASGRFAHPYDYQWYGADSERTALLETVGTGKCPQDNIMLYCEVSGRGLDFRKINNDPFQREFGNTSGDNPHEASQKLRMYLKDNGCLDDVDLVIFPSASGQVTNMAGLVYMPIKSGILTYRRAENLPSVYDYSMVSLPTPQPPDSQP